MKKVVVSLAFLAAVGAAHAKQENLLSFVDKTFDDFVKRMIPMIQQERFSKYHANFVAKLSHLDKDAHAEKKSKLRKMAFDGLERDHKAWADEINSFLADVKYVDQSYDPKLAEIREFLDRYGIYKDYCGPVEAPKAVVQVADAQEKGSRKAWDNFKSGVSKATHKVGSWFKNIKSQVMS